MERQIAEAATIAASIHAPQQNYEGIRQYYKTLFTVITEHNTRLAKEIAEILGQIQFQDAVRQRIERIESAMARRNDVLSLALRQLGEPNSDLTQLPTQKLVVLSEYLAIEKRHSPAGADAAGKAAELPKIELF
jgi:methyl-accepting chemotaxis protein